MDKEKLYNYCLQHILDRVASSKEAIASAQKSANDDSKSSAGDKHETARAMAQLEVEKHSKILAESEKLSQVMYFINPADSLPTVGLGSIVKTDKGNFYIAISIGKVELEGDEFVVLSGATPLGKQMIGHQKDDTFTFNNITYTILEVL